MNKVKWENNQKKSPDAYVLQFIEMLYAKRYMHLRNMFLYIVYQVALKCKLKIVLGNGKFLEILQSNALH